MTTVTWVQLTPDEQTTLDYFCENGVPVGVHVSHLPACYGTLSNYGLMTFTQTAQAVMVDVTPAGIAVWQQGQAASAPRSVWVAMWRPHESTTSKATYIVAVCESRLSARIACENVHRASRLKWSDDELHGYDSVRGGYYEISEMPILP